MEDSIKEEKYRKIKPSVGFLQKYNIKSFEIKFVNMFALEKRIVMSIVIGDYENAIDDISKLRKLICKKERETKIEIKFDVDEELIFNDVKGFITFVIEYKKTEKNKYAVYLTNYEIKIFGNIIYLELLSQEAVKKMKQDEIFKALEMRISKVLNRNLKIEIVDKNFESDINDGNNENNENDENKEIKENKKNEENSVNNENNDNKKDKKPLVGEVLPENVIKGSSLEYSSALNGESSFKKSMFKGGKIKNAQKFEISDLKNIKIGENGDNRGRPVGIEGKIFKIDVRETKNNSLMYDFLITDYNDSINCKIFLNPKDEAQIAILKVNDWVKVKGYYKKDSFYAEDYIGVQDLESIESEEVKKEDKALKKRIELHAHTNMSEMSGVMSIKDYAKRIWA